MKIGFIGTGNMAQAIIGGLLSHDILSASAIYGSDHSEFCLKEVSNRYHIQTTSSNADVVRSCDVVFLSVKPQYYEAVIHEVRDEITAKHILISIAPGKTLLWLGEQVGKPSKIVRTMPNTPALVGEGMTGVCMNSLVSEEDIKVIMSILTSFGRAEIVPEALMDAVVAVSGSSPAYIFLLIEAMADAAVAEGMSRVQAYEFAAQAVYGSAKMVLDTNKHPGELKDMVCSPGGTTIEGVQALEETGFRSSVMQAMRVVAEKSRQM